jgi:hypothetical protein
MRRRALWTALFAIAIGVLVFLVVLIGIGYLRLPAASPGTVTISEIQWNIEQGTTGSGQGWFGPSQVNDSKPPLPLSYAAGSTFQISWSAFNRDNVAHTVYTVSTLPPFQYVGSTPSLAYTVPAGDDSAGFLLSFSTSGSTAGTYVLTITVNALGSG